MWPGAHSSPSAFVVFILGWDLPFGRISAPGAGMLPKFLAGMMIALAPRS